MNPNVKIGDIVEIRRGEKSWIGKVTYYDEHALTIVRLIGRFAGMPATFLIKIPIDETKIQIKVL